MQKTEIVVGIFNYASMRAFPKKYSWKSKKMQKTDLYAQKNTRSRVGWPKIFLFYFSAPKVVQSAKNRNENFLFCVELKIISLFFQKKRWRFAKGTGSTEKRNRNKKPIIWKNSPWQITYVQKIFMSKISYFSVRWAMFWSVSTILPTPDFLDFGCSQNLFFFPN